MKWLADENFDNVILKGILRRLGTFDVLRAQDLEETFGYSDEVLLATAARVDRAVLSHDKTTIYQAVRNVLASGVRCAPVLLVPPWLPRAVAIEQIILLDQCSVPCDWEPLVLYLPIPK